MDPRPRIRGRFQKREPANGGAGEASGAGERFVTLERHPGDIAAVASPAGPGVNPVFDADTPASLEAEASAATAGAPVDLEAPAPGAAGALAGPPAGPTEDQIRAGYKLLCGELVDLGAVSLVPAWRVTPAESGKLAGAMAEALLLWFPDNIIPPKYLALLTVAGVAFEIAQARRDSNGRYLPARVQEKAGEASQTAAH